MKKKKIHDIIYYMFREGKKESTCNWHRGRPNMRTVVGKDVQHR